MYDNYNPFHMNHDQEENTQNTEQASVQNTDWSTGSAQENVPQEGAAAPQQSWQTANVQTDAAWMPPQDFGWQQPVQSYQPAVPSAVTGGKKPKKQHRHAGFAAIAVVAVILCGAVGFTGAYFGNRLAASEASSDSKVIYQSVQRTATGGGTDADALSVADVARLAADSVVEIRTESVVTGSFMQQYISEGAGSGVIITSDGYIVTNNHVIEGASRITVILRDGTSYEATLIGRDSKTDIAVVKIDASGLTAAVYGDSSKLVVGETAVAIGNPLGELGGTVTSGIISALDRSITIDGETMTLLQTNAAINPGNSGGGLFNQYGELIGIVNAKSSGTDIEGLGFAIPINTARDVIEEIMENGYVSGRISLGLSIVDISDAETAMAYRVSKTGVYVSQVNDPTSGFQAGDRIISFNGVSIDDAETLKNEISSCKVGQTVTVEVERRGERHSFQLTLQEEKPE